MNDSPEQQLDKLFRIAANAIDAGDVVALMQQLTEHPLLVRERLKSPGAWLQDKIGNSLTGFFKQPYLLWFVAEDPVRIGKLPANIADVAKLIIDVARRAAVPSLQEQLDYALTLVSWSWIARECGVQIALIDVLVDAGAALDGNPDNALVNHNVAAAAHLVERGAALTLATALCLGKWSEIDRLAASSTDRQTRFALVLALLNGKSEAVPRMVEVGADLNAPSEDLYSHGTPLHHAVCSGSLETVRTMVESGANVDAIDTAWNGTPLGWAEHYMSEQNEAPRQKQYAKIASYLRTAMERNR